MELNTSKLAFRCNNLINYISCAYVSTVRHVTSSRPCVVIIEHLLRNLGVKFETTLISSGPKTVLCVGDIHHCKGSQTDNPKKVYSYAFFCKKTANGQQMLLAEPCSFS